MKFLIEEAIPCNSKECLNWPFGGQGTGYGMVKIGAKRILVHRYVCEATHGPSPTDLHEVAHNCGNRSCCNPNHLRWATKPENSADKIIHGTHNRGTRQWRSKLTENDVRAIRSMAEFASQSEIGRRFEVSQGTVFDIIHRKTWAWLD